MATTADATASGVSFARSYDNESSETARTRPRAVNKQRRSSSLLTDSSYDAGSHSASSVADIVENEVEASLWYSVPLLLAIVPALAGLVFNKGSIIITDLALLALAAVYLHWCLLTPWAWYHAAQAVTVANASVVPEEAVDDDESNETEDGLSKDTTNAPALDTADKMAASAELRLHELLALSMCFAGPLVGAYILNLVRGQIAIGHDMVTNMHLTLFVLGAEIRPLRYTMKMVHARTLHLQRRVREDPYVAHGGAIDSTLHLGKRIDALDASMAELASAKSTSLTKSSPESTEGLKKLQSGLQTQVDALNRAVRRYEKRATAQTLQTEARLQDLEFRLKDALSLAAAAAAYSQKPGGFVMFVEWLSWAMTLPLSVAHAAVLYPLTLAATVVNRAMVRIGLAKPMLPRRSAGKQPLYRVRESDM